MDDLQLAKILRNCQSLPGQELFQYIAGNGEPCKISSEDVNEYLRPVTGEYFSAKDFRTWVGTVEAVRLLSEIGPASTQAEVKHNYATVVQQVSEKLGNRPATTKKYYIHPAVFEAYTDGALFQGNSARSVREGVTCHRPFVGTSKTP